jgi:hypothetical protein
MNLMTYERDGFYSINSVFRIVLGYITVRRSEMVGNIIVTTPNTSTLIGVEHRGTPLVTCA